MEFESKVAGKNLEGAEADPIQYAYLDPESVVYLESISIPVKNPVFDPSVVDLPVAVSVPAT